MNEFLWVQNYQQSDVRIKPKTAGWEARMLPLCFAVPLELTVKSIAFMLTDNLEGFLSSLCQFCWLPIFCSLC